MKILCKVEKYKVTLTYSIKEKTKMRGIFAFANSKFKRLLQSWWKKRGKGKSLERENIRLCKKLRTENSVLVDAKNKLPRALIYEV